MSWLNWTQETSFFLLLCNKRDGWEEVDEMFVAEEMCEEVLFNDDERVEEVFVDEPVGVILFGFGNLNTIRPFRLENNFY